jgi:DNA repair photolyase
MAAHGLVSVLLTITSFEEKLRRLMEPRTTTANQRLRVIHELSALGIPTGVMLGPVIPGLNDHEMPSILNQASAAGATFAAYTFIRLNGSVKLNFHEWLFRNFPDRAEKVWHLIEQAHGGKVSDSRFGIRMRGEGPLADVIRQQFGKYCKRFGLNKQPVALNCSDFWTPGRQLNLFG